MIGKQHRESLATILIVEDDVRMRDMMTEMFSPLCDRVVRCGDGAQAISRYNDLRPSVVVMDIRLPGMDGLEATERILRSHPSARIYIVTAYNEKRYRERAETIGSRGFFLKDDLGLLYDALEELGSAF